MTYRQLLARNKRWWSTPGSTYTDHPLPKIQGAYDRDEIIEENRNSAKVVELNQYVITLDFQDDTSEDINHGTVADLDYLKQIDRSDLSGIISYSFQRPYISFLADPETFNSIYQYLYNTKDIGFLGIKISDLEKKYNNKALKSSPAFKTGALTISYFKNVNDVIVDTGYWDRKGIMDNSVSYATFLNNERRIPINGKYNLYYCMAIYADWANSKSRYYIPKGYIQSKRKNPTDYFLSSLIKGAQVKRENLPREISPVFPPSEGSSSSSTNDVVKWPKGRIVNGKKYGLWVNYDEDGIMEEAGNYMIGIKVGAWTTYNKDGTINSSGIYRNDRREGLWMLFYPSGELNAEGNFTNDEQSGRWIVYHENGDFKKYVDF